VLITKEVTWMSRQRLILMLLALVPAMLFAGGRRERELRAADVFRRPLNVALPDTAGGPAVLTLRFGAGKLAVTPGARRSLASGELATGEAVFNNELFQPTIRREGRHVTLSAGDGRLELKEFIELWGKVADHQNRWELTIAPVPLELELDLGASSTSLQLGGLPLHRLRIAQGAADLTLSIDRPNPVEMSLLSYSGGASGCTLKSLANANASRLEVFGGGGVFHLDFSGRLRRDLSVKLEAGAGEVTLAVPEETTIEVEAHTGLAVVDFRGTWNKPSERLYRHEGSSPGQGPRIIVDAAVLAGRLRLWAGD
jgi:hypothetical protein